MLVVFLPLLGVLNTKAGTENLSDRLEWHAFAFWVEEEDKYPTKEADTTVESKGATWRQSFHHGQEGRCNDYVGSPASDGVL